MPRKKATKSTKPRPKPVPPRKVGLAERASKDIENEGEHIFYRRLANALPKMLARRRGERKIYVSQCPDPLFAQMRLKGYDVVDTMTMPRNKTNDHISYLLAFTQGVSEGTIEVGPSQMRALELDMKARGLLDKATKTFNMGDTEFSSVKEALGWTDSRHATSASLDLDFDFTEVPS